VKLSALQRRQGRLAIPHPIHGKAHPCQSGLDTIAQQPVVFNHKTRILSSRPASSVADCPGIKAKAALILP
jgi:hypothetical protein